MTGGNDTFGNGSALTIGKFDGFHLGHKFLLDRVKTVAAAESLSAVCCKVNVIKEGIMSQEENHSYIQKAGLILETLDFTPEFKAMLPEQFIREILVDKFNVRYIAIGPDFRFGRDRVGDVDYLKQMGDEFGYRVEIFDKLCLDEEPVSSSRIRRLLAEGDIEGATRLMGHDFVYMGKVEHGKKLGTNLGYPTINLASKDKVYPRYGVYSSQVIMGNDKYDSITNIGIRPTIDDDSHVSVETFIYNFDNDIYGTDVTVKLNHYIRKEKRFDSIEELKEQITKDISHQ